MAFFYFRMEVMQYKSKNYLAVLKGIKAQQIHLSCVSHEGNIYLCTQQLTQHYHTLNMLKIQKYFTMTFMLFSTLSPEQKNEQERDIERERERERERLRIRISNNSNITYSVHCLKYVLLFKSVAYSLRYCQKFIPYSVPTPPFHHGKI